MKTTAAVLFGTGKPFEIVELDLDGPGEGEVLINYTAAGLCHSDLHLTDGDLPTRFPIVGGHEGAGIIEDVGPGVTKVKPGDHVVCSFIPSCGHCRYCSTGKQSLCDMGATILEGYGATECSPVISCNLPQINRPGSVGPLLPGIETMLTPVDGIAEGGLLSVRGPNVMSGYLFAHVGYGDIHSRPEWETRARHLGRKLYHDIKTRKKYPFQKLLPRIQMRVLVRKLIVSNIRTNKDHKMKAVYKSLVERNLLAV